LRSQCCRAACTNAEGANVAFWQIVLQKSAVWRHCIVAKRRDKPYRSGRSPDWIKVKNPDAPAATRLIENDL
jgi:hypothetical protein